MEAELVTRIGHPNIVQVYDFGRLPDDSLYFVMEMIKGESLNDASAASRCRIRRWCRPLPTALGPARCSRHRGRAPRSGSPTTSCCSKGKATASAASSCLISASPRSAAKRPRRCSRAGRSECGRRRSRCRRRSRRRQPIHPCWLVSMRSRLLPGAIMGTPAYIWRRSRSRTRPKSTSAPTSTPSASCSTKCWPVVAPSTVASAS